MREPQWLGTGVEQEITPTRQRSVVQRHEQVYDYAVKSQTHMWQAITQHLLSDSDLDGIEGRGGTPHLDGENLLGIHLGCFICEQPYESRLRKRRCPGEPAS